MPPVSAIQYLEERAPSREAEFKQQTLRKLSGLRCPDHQQPPRVQFRGTTLQTITIQMSGCCDALIALANQKIAGL